MRSIQRDLVLRLLAVVIALSAASSAGLYFYVRSRLSSEFEHGLRTRAQMVAGMVSWEDGKLEFNGPEPEFFGSSARAHAGEFEIWNADGSVFVRSTSLKDRDLPRLAASDRIYKVGLKDSPNARAFAHDFIPHEDIDATHPQPPPPLMTLVVVEDASELAATLGILATAMVLATIVLAAASALAVVMLVRQGLRPLHELANRADSIAADSLHERFATSGLPDELRPIADRLNQLLARLGDAFDRERRFTADVAHELRTPIAELRTLAEVAMKWPDESAAERNYADTLAIARHMEELVTALLAIARSEAGRIHANLGPTDLCPIILAAWESSQAQANSKALQFVEALPSSLMVRSDPLLLPPLVGNLLSNAVAHAPAGGQIVCRAEAVEGAAQLSILNSNDSIEESDLPHLFEPFWRKDSARTGSIHVGLGLTLVAAYAKMLGIEIKPRLRCEGMFEMILTIPLAGPSNGKCAGEEPDNSRRQVGRDAVVRA